MTKAEANNHPAAFARADANNAARRLADIIRGVKPQVVVTYNERGGYGHPDHIMANNITVKAFQMAGDDSEKGFKISEAWQPQKLYYTATPLERLRKRHQLAIDRGEKPRMNPEFMGTPDHLITTAIDVETFIQKKLEALSCHKSQIGPNSFFRQIPEDQFMEYFKYEYFVCESGCEKTGNKESDFFDGVVYCPD